MLQGLIQEIGLQVRTKKQRKYNSYKGEQDKIVPNLLQAVEKLPKNANLILPSD